MVILVVVHYNSNVWVQFFSVKDINTLLDVLHQSIATVKTFIMLQKISVSNKFCSLYSSKNPEWKCITVSTKNNINILRIKVLILFRGIVFCKQRWTVGVGWGFMCGLSVYRLCVCVCQVHCLCILHGQQTSYEMNTQWLGKRESLFSLSLLCYFQQPNYEIIYSFHAGVLI